VIRAGKWITLVSVALAVLCAIPIQIYAAFGPEDGNPVGLGLLMVFGAPFFGSIAVLGIVIWVIGLIACRN
jgi:ABC-type proline/glycine betaine transport system permease subunit